MRIVNPPTLRWRTVRLLIAFQGTRYEGWQSQKKGSTVQEIFEKNLSRIFKTGTPITGSSRTDSGVHAKGFVAHFKTTSKLPDAKIKDALNFYLPKDIAVLAAKTVKADFHARFHAKSKIYSYLIYNSKTKPVFEEPYVYWYPFSLDLPKMKKAATYFKGRHDFAAFRDGKQELKSTIRTIKKITIKRQGSIIEIQVQGDGFLMHMVRIVVGTLLWVGQNKIPASKISQILSSKNRSLAGPTARSQGLTLLKVLY